MSEFFIEVDKGEIVQRNVVAKYFNEMKKVDGSYKITIEQGKRRSGPQNRYFHSVLLTEFKNALTSVGYRIKDNEQAKDILKSMFLTRKVESQDENSKLPEVTMTRDTRKLTTKEMNELIEEVIQFCAEHMNYQIPLPNEDLRLGFE